MEEATEEDQGMKRLMAGVRQGQALSSQQNSYRIASNRIQSIIDLVEW
jgi:hypothetical protein